MAHSQILLDGRIGDDLFEVMNAWVRHLPGGLAIATILACAFFAAITGSGAATAATIGMVAYPAMTDRGYDKRFTLGLLAAGGTLGILIPPSVILVLLGDVLSNAYQQAQLKQGIYAPKTVAVGDLFSGALIPGMVLVALYLVYILWTAWRHPERAPAIPAAERSAIGPSDLIKALVAPLGLILAALGSILYGFATPTEAAAVGAVGAMVLAAGRGTLSRDMLAGVAQTTAKLSSMAFMLLFGASVFILVFRGLGGDVDARPDGALGRAPS